MKRVKDEFTRGWIIQNALEEIAEHKADGIELTLRGLHYKLVSRGMTNTQNHYKRVTSAMVWARWEGLVPFDAFKDNDREVIGRTEYEETVLEDEIETAKDMIDYYAGSYYLNRWENQPYYLEVWIEKKALIGAFKGVCENNGLALAPCKGYPSLTFLNEAVDRFQEAKKAGKRLVILYFGDYDPSGEDIPRSIEQNLFNLGAKVDVHRISLLKNQVIEWNLPPAPAKKTDSRTKNWDGLGQVELDAVDARKLRALCQDAIDQYFDYNLLEDLKERQAQEKQIYKQAVIEFIRQM